MEPGTNSFVADVVWIRRGIAKAVPDKVEIGEAELRELLQANNLKETSDDNSDENEIEEEPKRGLRGSACNTPATGDDFDLASYDEEPAHGPSFKGLAYYASQMDDPYITRHRDSEDEEEKDDFELKPTDNLVAVAKTAKGDYAVDVYVYNENDDDWYLHHDYVLDAPPLCLAPIFYDPGSDDNAKGNLLAVGTMEPAIGVWDLDVVNSLEPVVWLGEKIPKKRGVAKKSRRKRDGTAQGHRDAVLSLDWNARMAHILASGGADSTVVLWDLDAAKAAQCLHADGMVQSLRWHPVEESILMTGTRSGTAAVRNCKASDAEKSLLEWSLGVEVEVENVLWNHFQPYYAFVCSDDGKLRYIDTRKPGEFVADVSAHNGGVNSVSQSFHVRNLITTAGDKELKVWKLENHASFRLVHTHPLRVGDVRVARFSPDASCALAVGVNAHESNARVLDWARVDAVVDAFNDNAAAESRGGDAARAVITPKSRRPDDEEEESDDEAEGVMGEREIHDDSDSNSNSDSDDDNNNSESDADMEN